MAVQGWLLRSVACGLEGAGAVSRPRMQEFGRILVLVGVGLVVVGVLLWSGFGRGWLGRLPGDVHLERGGVSFHFPVVTCLVLSVLVSGLMWLFRK